MERDPSEGEKIQYHVYHMTQAFHHEEEKKWGKGITLMKAM